MKKGNVKIHNCKTEQLNFVFEIMRAIMNEELLVFNIPRTANIAVGDGELVIGT